MIIWRSGPIRLGWLGFHDGINNLSRADRFHALRAEADPAAPWMDTGTYMVFLKLAVDLDLWRSLDRATQEAIVGRKKLSGVPLTSIRQTGLGFQAEGDPVCPFHPLGPRPDPATMECVDPRFGDARTLASHVFRSNLSRGPANLDAANRFYRQGYEFLDIDASGAVTVGLNFVEFTGHPARILRILQDRDWLGDVNFGGGIGGVPAPRLMRLLAGGIFATPALPKDPLRFPGQEIFDEAPFADALLS